MRRETEFEGTLLSSLLKFKIFNILKAQKHMSTLSFRWTWKLLMLTGMFLFRRPAFASSQQPAYVFEVKKTGQ